jgi:cellulose 1,4-beta-cellobiosidase
VDPSSGATSYNVYSDTSSEAELGSLIATTKNTMYTDPNLSAQPVYFYRVTAVNAAGESAQSEAEASMTPPPVATGGDIAGQPSGDGRVYYAVDALL